MSLDNAHLADMASSVNKFRLGRDPTSRSRRSASPTTPRSKRLAACDRCRSFKKKCSRTFPICSLCARSGHDCSLSTPVSSDSTEAHDLRARVQWLSRHVKRALPAGAVDIDDVETGTDLTRLLPTTPRVDSPAGDVDISLHAGTKAHDTVSHGSATQLPQAPSNHIPVSSPSSWMPPDAAARRFVDAYFRNVNRAYPFIDRGKVLRDLESLTDLAPRRQEPDSRILYLIMAIGCTTLQRAGQIPDDTASKFEVAYAEIIQECISRETIDSVKILVLLALYSLFDPAGASAWSMIGIISRQAMVLGLTRLHSGGKSLSPTEMEMRHRLYWSILVLDRMMAMSLGLPAALNDENGDVPLPGLTIEEFSSPYRPSAAAMLQTSRHVIQLRQIEDRILRQIHFKKQSDVMVLSAAERCSILQSIRADLDDWYSSGCLVTTPETDNLPIHSSVNWLSARYHFLLVMMYYPTHFNSSTPAVTGAELLRYVQKHVQCTSSLFGRRQLPLNRVTLCRLFPIGLLLMHIFAAALVEGSTLPRRDEVVMIVNILNAFPEGWADAHRGAYIFQQFLDVIDAIRQVHGGFNMAGIAASASSSPRPNQHQPVPARRSFAGAGNVANETYQSILKQHMDSLVVLMEGVLGSASSFLLTTFPAPELGTTRTGASGYSFAAAVNLEHQSIMHRDGDIEDVPIGNLGATGAAAVPGVSDTMDGYGWGTLDLDLLSYL